MKIGLSLGMEFLLGCPKKEGYKDLLAQFERPREFLLALEAQGFTHVELRYIKHDAEADSVLAAARVVWSAGLGLTVHAKLEETCGEESFTRLYPSLRGVLAAVAHHQAQLVLTVHGFAGKHGRIDWYADETVGTLREWVSLLERDALPVRIALELKRAKDRYDPTGSCPGVLGVVDRVGRERLGVCWDMGHFRANILSGVAPDAPPPPGFAARTIHTHLHGLSDGADHFPFAAPGSLPLESYVSMLRATGYDGVYNLEFSFDKLPRGKAMTEAIYSSAERLRACHAGRG